MTTTTTKPGRKRRTTTPTHPAILALRAEHAAFAARHAPEEMHACFTSDLAHDERALTEHNPAAFGWIINPHSTHLRRGVLDAGEARSEISASRHYRPWLVWASNVADAYGHDRCAFYVWTGTSLERCSDVADLARRMDTLTARVALADAERRLTEAREDRAACGSSEGIWTDRCAARVSEIEAEIASLRSEYL